MGIFVWHKEESSLDLGCYLEEEHDSQEEKKVHDTDNIIASSILDSTSRVSTVKNDCSSSSSKLNAGIYFMFAGKSKDLRDSTEMHLYNISL